MTKRAFVVAAHPDDIEFLMAGTLILLKKAGYEIHYMTIANGSCGTLVHSLDEIIRFRKNESQAAAEFIGAIYHQSLVNDLEIFYEKKLLAKVGAIMREVAPEILLVHSPTDYMEDHQNAARLAVTAAFCRGMSNFPTDPLRKIVEQDVTVYHAQPNDNRDPLGQLIYPQMYIDISSVIKEKKEMLAFHRSQKEWLDKTQGMDSFILEMERMCREVGEMSGCFEFAEGWRKRTHTGFCSKSADPLFLALKNYVFIHQEKLES